MTVAAAPYFHDGGHLYAPQQTLHDSFVSTTLGKGLSLWNGSSNNAPPASWQTPSFNDTSWGAVYDVTTGTTGSSAPAVLWTSVPPLSSREQILVRQHVTLPAGADVLGATLYFYATEPINGRVLGVWINGTFLPFTDQSVSGNGTPDTVIVDPALLVVGDNLIAAEFLSSAQSGTPVAGGYFDLIVTLNVPGAPVPTYAAAILADSPLAYWPLDEAAGSTFVDATGHGHDATLVAGGAGSLSYGTPGPQPFSKALRFTPTVNGTAPCLQVAQTASFPPDPFGPWSIEVWFQEDTGGAAQAGLWGYGDQGGATPGQNALTANGTQGIAHTIEGPNTPPPPVELTTQIGTRQLVHAWHHVVVTLDGLNSPTVGNVLTFYVDGDQLSLQHRFQTPFTRTDLFLGSTYPPTGGSVPPSWVGGLAEVAVYGACLTQAQVQAHYVAGQVRRS